MREHRKWQRLLQSSALVTVAMLASPALAQDADDDGDTIVVTGSRLNTNLNLEAASPVLTVSGAEIESRGVVNVEDLVNQLPQVFAGQGSEVSNGATGTATLNLRGLGAVRTLTMIDGRRLPYGSSQEAATNLDLVPTQLIDRVEILTGGASAVYGSDAVGGVANFILKRDFEGIQFDGQYSFFQTGNDDLDRFNQTLMAADVPVPGSVTDGDQYAFAVTMGANTADGRGNVTLFASYQDREEITQDNRSYSACALGADRDTVTGYSCSGSGNFRLFGPGEDGFVFQQEDGTIVPFVDSPEQTFNFGPFNFFQRPQERWQIYSMANYEFADGHEVFADLSYYNAISDAQIAPSASFGIGSYSINCDNPLIQDTDGIELTDVFGCSDEDIAEGNDVDGITASHRNVEGGPRSSRLENSTLRMVGGVRGSFLETWDYEQFFQYSQTRDEQVSTNDFIGANLQQAFFAVEDDDGNIVCRDPSGGCVPYNIFQRGDNGESLVSQESLDFIQGVGIVVGNTTQSVIGGSVQTDLGNYGIASPFSENGVGFLVGYEWRSDYLDARPDQIFQVPGGGFTGLGGATLPVQGRVNVAEVFTEIQVPLATDRPFIDELVLSGQYRYSDYSARGNETENEFSTNAYGATLIYAPADQISFRAQYQRSVRAPNVVELYTGQDVGLPNLNEGANELFDPCAGPDPAASLEACQRTGVTEAQYGSILDVISGQTQGIFGGNTDLDPETSDTYTVGLVFEPTFVDGLSVSVDWFQIEVEDFITEGIGAQTILTQCLETGSDQFCSLLNRDAQGSLNSGTPGVGFTLINRNIAQLETSGIDIQVGYNLDLGPSLGDVVFQYAGTVLDTFDFTPFPGGDPIECAGKFGNDCEQPVNSEYRHRLLTTWRTPFDVDVIATWRHFGGVENISATPAIIDRKLDQVNYLDLAVNWEAVEDVRFRLGVNNVFDQKPPVSVSAGPPLGNGNTYPVAYDIGRFVFMGVNVTF